MNKNKKLQKGMSLVEVLVAMTIFSVGTAAVTMAFASAVRYNVHNQRRDDELSAQQAALQNGKSSGMEVYDDHFRNMSITYTLSNGSKFPFKDESGNEYDPFDNASEFQASRTGKNDTVFDFQLKSFATTISGADKVKTAKSEDSYKISVTNESDVNYDVRIHTDGGTLFEGDIKDPNNCYKHSSNVFIRSLSPYPASGDKEEYKFNVDEDSYDHYIQPFNFEVGYKYPNLSAVPDDKTPLKFSFYKDGYIYRELDLVPSMITGPAAASGYCDITIDASGNIKADYK